MEQAMNVMRHKAHFYSPTVGQPFVPAALPIPPQFRPVGQFMPTTPQQAQSFAQGLPGPEQGTAQGMADAVPTDPQRPIKLVWENRPKEPGLYRTEMTFAVPVDVPHNQPQIIQKMEDFLNRFVLPTDPKWEMGLWMIEPTSSDPNAAYQVLEGEQFDQALRDGVDVEQEYGARWYKGKFGLNQQVMSGTTRITGVWFYFFLNEEWPSPANIDGPVTSVFEVPLSLAAKLDDSSESFKQITMTNEYAYTGGWVALLFGGAIALLVLLGGAYVGYRLLNIHELKVKSQLVRGLQNLSPEERDRVINALRYGGSSKSGIGETVETALNIGLLGLGVWIAVQVFKKDKKDKS
jgi:hypothetical protein